METLIQLLGRTFYYNSGTLFDLENKVSVPVFKAEGKQDYVLLYREGKGYQINHLLIQLYAQNSFHLPFELWDLVSVDLIPDVVQSHLIVKPLDRMYLVYPKEGIEIEKHPGYYYIPKLEKYGINKDGVCIDVETGELHKEGMRESVKLQNKRYPTVFLPKCKVQPQVHELLGTVFKEPPKDYPILVVDHLNGQRWDYSLDNLEWVTTLENNMRSVYNGNTNALSIVIKNTETDEEIKFPSQQEASRYLKPDGRPATVRFVSGVLKKLNQNWGNFIVKRSDDQRSWEEIAGTKPEKMPVKARHVETKEVFHFSSAREASRVLKIHVGSIQSNVKRVTGVAILGGYQFKPESDTTDWYDFNEHDIYKWKNGYVPETRVYKVIDTYTQEEKIVYGWKEVAKLTGNSKRTIIVYVKDRSRLLGRRWLCTLIS